MVAAIAAQVRHGARLLAGQAPEGLEGELEGEGIQLFPHPAEVVLSCSCDDPAPQCKHVVAATVATAGAIDEDPFVLLRLRGRGREELLAELAEARRRGPDGSAGDVRGMPISALSGTENWAEARAPLDDFDLEDLQLDPPLASLPDPPGWAGGVTAQDLFGPLVERGAAWAAEVTAAATP